MTYFWQSSFPFPYLSWLFPFLIGMEWNSYAAIFLKFRNKEIRKIDKCSRANKQTYRQLKLYVVRLPQPFSLVHIETSSRQERKAIPPSSPPRVSHRTPLHFFHLKAPSNPIAFYIALAIALSAVCLAEFFDCNRRTTISFCQKCLLKWKLPVSLVVYYDIIILLL